MTRHRKVFGRRRVTLDGKSYRIELRSDGLYARKKHARSERSMPLTSLVSELYGQKTLPLK